MVTNPRVRLLWLLALALAAGLVACGGGARKADANDWVADICKAAGELRQERSDALLRFFEVDPDDGAAMLAGLETYTKAYDAALDDFDRAAQAAGQPNVEDGGKVVGALDRWISAERSTNEDARAKAARLDRSSGGLAGEVERIFAKIEFADLRALLRDSKAGGAEQIIALVERDSGCAFELFAEAE